MNVRIQYATRFMAGIYTGNKLLMNDYTVKIYLMTNTYDPDEQNIALNRIKYFIYSEMENTIFVDQDDIDTCRLLSYAGLNITTMPGEPVDQVLGIMLYNKLSAITEGRLFIGEVEISSALGDGIVYLHGENENVDGIEIPEWWKSVDLAHCEEDLIEVDKVVTIHKNSVWRDLDLHWPGSDIKTADTNETGNTVVFADFKRLDDKE